MLKIIISLSLIFLFACQSKPVDERASILWKIVSTECVPNQKENKNPAPCAEVNFTKKQEQGYVVMKDKRGVLQYLLMPIAKIDGVESPELLAENSPNYFYESWKARSYMVKRNKAPIADENVSLAVNSKFGRSQNQMHIHISCIRQDVKDQLKEKSSSISEEWSLIPGGLLNHKYWARKITESDLKNKNIFSLVADGIPSAKNNMAEFGIALAAVKIKKTELILLADQVSSNSRASVEEIQDHACGNVVKK